MRNPGGYAIIVDPYQSQPKECDTFTCSHCNRVIFIKPRMDAADMGGFCTLCTKHICKLCAGSGERGDDGKCIPFEKKMEAMERRDRLMRALR
jgi:hypothetical protein